MSLLKMCFAHWLSIDSDKKIYRLHKSMIGRSTGLGHGGLAIDFSYHKNFVKKYIETYSSFNQLMFHCFEGLLPETLSSCKEFSKNLKFHNKSLSCSIS